MDSTAAILQALKETQVQCSYLYVPGLGQVVPHKDKTKPCKTKQKGVKNG